MVSKTSSRRKVLKRICVCLTKKQKGRTFKNHPYSEDTEGAYSVYYFGSDTTSEKAYEEFYVPGEKIDMQRFQSHGVVEQTTRHNMDEVDTFFNKLEAVFQKDDFTKTQVVDAIKEFIPNFEHEEKGRNLDQKM